jgi:DNA-(apurinic or apyrimidinic site) lyase
MRIDYPTRSKFISSCEEFINRNKATLLQGSPISIHLPKGGYEANITVTIERTNPFSFQTDWTNLDPSRFPVRIKAAAYALFTKGCYGIFSISHFSGIITIQPLKLHSKSNILYIKETENQAKRSIYSPHIESKSTQKEKNSRVKDQLLEILRMIPSEAWQLIVKKEPEWQYLEPLNNKFLHGSFSVFMLAVGLNTYQLKGRAEITYWPRLYEVMKDYNSLPRVETLYEYLVEFYKEERLNAAKIERLSRFLGSPFAEKLWTKSPQEISSLTNHIWHSLGNVMRQELHEKSICFAMKCLGISLMMTNEYDFDIHAVPIPVDSRIIKFTNCLGIDIEEDIRIIQAFWKDIISSLHLTSPQINMIHLDSLIWQLAHHDTIELISYFEDLGIGEVGGRLAHLLKDINSVLKQNTRFASSDTPKFPAHELSRDKHILILVPCSGRKNDSVSKVTFSENEEKRVIDNLQNTRSLLTSGRDGLSDCIDHISMTIPALDRYDGYLYRSDSNFRDSIKQALSNENIHALILSGAYGVVTPSERIHDYEKKMIASYWIIHGLPKIIEEFIILNKMTHVYGFFSKSTDYMKVLKDVNWTKLNDRCNLQSAKVYYVELSRPGGALKIVPDTLGKLITNFIYSGFNEAHFYENPFHGQYVDFINFIKP